MNRTGADRKVAADYIEKQYQKVKRSLDGLVEISRDARILSVQVIGNGLPASVSWASTSRGWEKGEFRPCAPRCWGREGSMTITTSMTNSTTESWRTDFYGGNLIASQVCRNHLQT